MSIDRSLRMKSSLERHRNVLSRAERVMLLKDQDRWRDEQSPLGLPKVAHRKAKAGRKKAAKVEGAEAAAAPGTPGAPGAAAPAAPAAGAAPAAKGAAKPAAAKPGAKPAGK